MNNTSHVPNKGMLSNLTVVSLSCFLREDEALAWNELTNIQRANTGSVPAALREGLARRERQLVRELNHIKRLQLTTPHQLLVTLVDWSGAA